MAAINEQSTGSLPGDHGYKEHWVGSAGSCGGFGMLRFVSEPSLRLRIEAPRNVCVSGMAREVLISEQ